ncbi:hypothetical protein D3C79_774420 [compost metagenome]
MHVVELQSWLALRLADAGQFAPGHPVATAGAAREQGMAQHIARCNYRYRLQQGGCGDQQHVVLEQDVRFHVGRPARAATAYHHIEGFP